jgi:hypothetical protein
MFWGCISGRYGKGAGIFWEKEWGTITTKSYCEHTVPAILNYLSRRWSRAQGSRDTCSFKELECEAYLLATILTGSVTRDRPCGAP